MTQLNLLTESAADPVIDTALSTAILQQVAAGDLGPTLRLFTPARVVAFGSQDRTRDGYREAVAGVVEAGFGAVERLAGGRAAVFHEGTLAFAWALPTPDPKVGIEERFVRIASLIVDALASLGIDSAIGEIEGEYCPGRFSVNSSGRKVMGVGQRLVSGAAHIGGVLVAHSPELINDALIPAYRALGYEWDPAVTGAVGTEVVAVRSALETAFEAAGFRLNAVEFESSTRNLADDLAARHRPPIA